MNQRESSRPRDIDIQSHSADSDGKAKLLINDSKLVRGKVPPKAQWSLGK